MPIEGTVSPHDSFEAQGMKCRKITLVAKAKGQTQTWTPSACKHSDGKWKLLKQ